MSKAFRRYEILLPRRFNDGSPVPEELIAQTLLELREQFGPVSSETQTIQGSWEHEGLVFRDDLVRVFVDAPDTRSTRTFFKSFKKHLETRFQQIDIWLTTHPIELL